jgi:ammonia channel protein AmtB
VAQRNELRKQWNQPKVWPLLLVGLLLLWAGWLVRRALKQREDS